jgi:hypothetical protein
MVWTWSVDDTWDEKNKLLKMSMDYYLEKMQHYKEWTEYKIAKWEE